MQTQKLYYEPTGISRKFCRTRVEGAESVQTEKEGNGQPLDSLGPSG